MVRPPYFDINGVKKGAWSKDEDNILKTHVERFGHPNWRLLPFHAGIPRCGKSCRLRWMNYLKPGLKRGKFTKHEEDLIIKLHDQLGNKWSAIAAKFPGRTDNEIKNYWHAHIEKRGKHENGKVMMPQMELLEQSSCDDVYVVSPQSDAENMDAPNPTNTDPIYLVNAQVVPHQAAQSNNDVPIFVDQESYDIGLYMINDIYSQPELLRIWSESLGEDTFDVHLW